MGRTRSHRCPPWCHVCSELRAEGSEPWEAVLPECMAVAVAGAREDWRSICVCDRPENFKAMDTEDLREEEGKALREFRDAARRLRAIRAALRRRQIAAVASIRLRGVRMDEGGKP